MLHRCRRQAVEKLARVFVEGEKPETVKEEHEHKIQELYKKIGRLTTPLVRLEKRYPKRRALGAVGWGSSQTLLKTLAAPAGRQPIRPVLQAGGPIA